MKRELGDILYLSFFMKKEGYKSFLRTPLNEFVIIFPFLVLITILVTPNQTIMSSDGLFRPDHYKELWNI